MSKMNKLPVCKGHWLWKNFFEVAKNPLEFAEEKRKILGDSFYIDIPGSEKTIMTANPHLIKQVIQGNPKNYMRPKRMKQLGLLVGQGIPSIDGEQWKKQRKILQPAFHKKNLAELFESILAAVQQHLEEMQAKEGQVANINFEMADITSKIILKIFFSRNQLEEFSEVIRIIQEGQSLVSKRAVNPFMILWTNINGEIRKYKKHKKVLDRIILDIIMARKNVETPPSDLLQALLDARFEDTGEPMPFSLIKDEFISIFFAGHDTSANTLTVALYLLVKHPETMQKLRHEVDQVLGNDRMPSLDDLRRMPYTRQVVNEVMRMHPAVWMVPRQSVRSDEWNGYSIEANTNVMCDIYGMHRHPDFWEEPDVFNPDRFANNGQSKFNANEAYLPFGAGSHMCIGMNLAMMEIQLILPLLVREFDFELVDDRPIEKLPLISLVVHNIIKMKLHARKKG